MDFKKLNKPYIIAEIGINHEGNYSLAKKLVFEANKAGADAVKFQVFKPSTLAIEKSKKNKLQKKNSGKESLFKIWNRVCLKFSSLKKLRDYAKKLKIDFICTPFDFESLQLVKKLNLNAIKIASSDITDIPLIIEISKINKPVILSTGMANTKEITKAVNCLKKKNLTLLHCVSMYPCEFKNANLKRIISLKKNFNKYTIGYSDHCKNIDASIFALSLGAMVIEKHFTLDKKREGLDHSLSADPIDLKTICEYAKNINNLSGKNKIKPSYKERNFIKYFRKGIYILRKLKKGQIIKKENLIIRRPQNSVKPETYQKLIGKRVRKSLNAHEGINLKYIY